MKRMLYGLNVPDRINYKDINDYTYDELTEYILIKKDLNLLIQIYNHYPKKDNQFFNFIVNLSMELHQYGIIKQIMIIKPLLTLENIKKIIKSKLMNENIINEIMLERFKNASIDVKKELIQYLPILIQNKISNFYKEILKNYPINNYINLLLDLSNNQEEDLIIELIPKYTHLLSNLNQNNDSLFSLAIKNNLLKVIDYLLNTQYCYFNPNNNNNTPLMMCSNEEYYLKIIDKFQNKINPNHLDNEGNTLLIKACQLNNNDISIRLLKYVNYQIVNHQGKTALYYAKKHKMNQFIKILIEEYKYDEYYYSNNSIKYQGGFNYGKFNSDDIAREYYPNNQIKYIGQFKDGKYQGIGKLYDIDNNLIFHGIFINGIASK